jgi:hypothetical protein
MAYGNEGIENGTFKNKKKVFELKLKIHIRWSNVFALPRSFVEL